MSMSRKKEYLLLAGILTIATFLRFYHFTDVPPGLFFDEAIDGNNAAEAATTGHWQVFYTEDDGREGLYVNMIAVLLRLGLPHEPWVIRLPAAVAGVLTVLGLYLLAAEFFGTCTGLVAAFLLAVSFWHINFSRIGFRAILAPLLLIWSVYVLLRAFKATSPSKGFCSAAAAGAIYALGFYTYIAYRITPLLFLLFIPFFKNYAQFWKRTAVFIIATFLAAAPIGWYFARYPGDFFSRTSQISVTNSGGPISHFAKNLAKTVRAPLYRGDRNWRHNLSGAPELFWPVAVAFVAGSLLGIYWLLKSWRKKDVPTFGWWLTFLWLALATLPAAASEEGIPHALRSILMLPPVIILAAVAGVWGYEVSLRHASRTSVNAFAVVVLAAVGAYGYYEYFVLWAGNPNVARAFNADYVAIGREINALPRSVPKYVIVKAEGDMTRGIPMPAETTIFITNSFLPEEQAAKNIHYLLPSETSKIPQGAHVFTLQ